MYRRCGRRRRRRRRKNEKERNEFKRTTHSAVRHVAQYRNTLAEVKVCKYRVSSPSYALGAMHPGAQHPLRRRGCIERKKPRRPSRQAASCVSIEPETRDILKYVETIWISLRSRFRIGRLATRLCAWKLEEGIEMYREGGTEEVGGIARWFTLGEENPTISRKQCRWYYDKIFTDRNRRGKEFSASTARRPRGRI